MTLEDEQKEVSAHNRDKHLLPKRLKDTHFLEEYEVTFDRVNEDGYTTHNATDYVFVLVENGYEKISHSIAKQQYQKLFPECKVTKANYC